MSEQESKPLAKPSQPSESSPQPTAAKSSANAQKGKKAADGSAKSATQSPSAKSSPASAAGSGQRTPRRSRAGIWLAILALLIALAAIAGGLYLWQRQQALQQQLQTQKTQQTEQRSQLSSLRDTVGSRADALQQRDDNIAKVQQDLRDSVESVRKLAGRSRRDWILAEVEYLLRIGNRRLQLQRDPATAIAALQIADERLQELADPGLTEVRERIARELDQLRATPRPDIDGIAVQLSSLQEQVPQLQVKSARAPSREALPGADDQRQAPTQAWREGLQRAWQALRRLVVIRRRDEPIKPLLGPEQEFAVRDGLRLQLEAARLALLRGDAAVYRASIHGAGDWMKRYFIADSSAYDAMKQRLQQLGEREIQPQLPDISASLRRLREIMDQRGLNTEPVSRETQPSEGAGSQQAPAGGPAAEQSPADSAPSGASGGAPGGASGEAPGEAPGGAPGSDVPAQPAPDANAQPDGAQ